MTHVAKTRATLSSPPLLPPTCMAPGQVDEAESPPPITSFGAVRLLELGFNAAFGLAPAEESGSDATKLSVGERGREHRHLLAATPNSQIPTQTYKIP